MTTSIQQIGESNQNAVISNVVTATTAATPVISTVELYNNGKVAADYGSLQANHLTQTDAKLVSQGVEGKQVESITKLGDDTNYKQKSISKEQIKEHPETQVTSKASKNYRDYGITENDTTGDIARKLDKAVAEGKLTREQADEMFLQAGDDLHLAQRDEIDRLKAENEKQMKYRKDNVDEKELLMRKDHAKRESVRGHDEAVRQIDEQIAQNKAQIEAYQNEISSQKPASAPADTKTVTSETPGNYRDYGITENDTTGDIARKLDKAVAEGKLTREQADNMFLQAGDDLNLAQKEAIESTPKEVKPVEQATEVTSKPAREEVKQQETAAEVVPKVPKEGTPIRTITEETAQKIETPVTRKTPENYREPSVIEESTPKNNTRKLDQAEAEKIKTEESSRVKAPEKESQRAKNMASMVEKHEVAIKEARELLSSSNLTSERIESEIKKVRNEIGGAKQNKTPTYNELSKVELALGERWGELKKKEAGFAVHGYNQRIEKIINEGNINSVDTNLITRELRIIRRELDEKPKGSYYGSSGRTVQNLENQEYLLRRKLGEVQNFKETTRMFSQNAPEVLDAILRNPINSTRRKIVLDRALDDVNAEIKVLTKQGTPDIIVQTRLEELNSYRIRLKDKQHDVDLLKVRGFRKSEEIRELCRYGDLGEVESEISNTLMELGGIDDQSTGIGSSGRTVDALNEDLMKLRQRQRIIELDKKNADWISRI